MHKQILIALMMASCCGNTFAQEPLPLTQAKKQGIAICQKLVEAGASLSIDNNDHYSRSTWNSATPNRRMFNSQIIVNFVDGHSVTSLTVAPTSTNACDGTYTRVFSIPKSCELLRRTTYKDWKDTTGEAGLTVLSIDNRDMIMMPFLTGCTTITTETIYE